ncbi:MAG: hypothetical protein ABJA37_15215 [Ferruginibacter sp.]
MLSAILLLLYLFIATPVQYWHHCKNHSHQQANQKQTRAFPSFTKSGENSHECKICTHQYTLYNNDVTTIQIEYVSDYINRFAFPQTFYLQQTACGLSNKSPPVV